MTFSFRLGFLMTLTFLLFSSCKNDGTQAENSLEGNWTITEITSYYGIFSETGFNAIETIVDSGDLGTFNFTTDMADFNFTRNDTMYTGSGGWSLQAEKVNSGFTKVNQFTLTIDNHFLFDVAFEDQTKNAEKDAQNLTFTSKSKSGDRLFLNMLLEKK